MNSGTPIAVIGATGQQGGAVASALLDRGVAVRALVRDPAKAKALTDRGAEAVAIDFDDPDSLRRGFDEAAAAYAMTTMLGPDGTEGEVTQGRAIADAARAAEVPQLVFSSVGGADRGTGIPHFDSKWRIEQYLAELDLPRTIIRPVLFIDNFTSFFAPQPEDDGLVLRIPLASGVPVQLVAVADIGAAAATALLDPGAVPGGAVELGGDELTGEQIAATFTAVRGVPTRFEPQPLDGLDDDSAAMFAWFRRLPAYQADLELTRHLVGRPTDFATFVAAIA